MKKRLLIGMCFPVLLFSENLNELIALSLQNKNVAASELGIQSIQEEYKSVKQGYLPSVTVGGGYTNVSNESAAAAKNSMQGYVDISYNLYDGGRKELTYSSYESQIKGSKEDIISLKNRITLSVIEYYFNYHTYVSQKEAKSKEIEQLNAQYSRLNKFLDAGTTTIDELDKILSRVESANIELHELDLNIQTIFHELRYITGRNVSIDADSYIESIEGKAELRNDIKSLEHTMQTMLTNAKAVKSANRPQVNINNTYTYYENDFDNSAYDSGMDDQNVLSLGVSWKVFDFGSTNKAYESAYKSYLSTKSSYEYQKNKANEDLDLALKSYEISKLKIKSARAGLHAANSTYAVTKQKYENGLVDNVSYLEALSERSDAQSSLVASKYALEIKKANVVYQKGKNVWEYVR